MQYEKCTVQNDSSVECGTKKKSDSPRSISIYHSYLLYTECKYIGPLGRRPGRVMKVRLVRPRCFVLTMLPLKSLASRTV